MTAVSFEFATAGRIMAGAGRSAELPGRATPVPLSQAELESVVLAAL
jgi:hypothetical protein